MKVNAHLIKNCFVLLVGDFFLRYALKIVAMRHFCYSDMQGKNRIVMANELTLLTLIFVQILTNTQCIRMEKMADLSESDKMIKINGKADELNTHNGFKYNSVN